MTESEVLGDIHNQIERGRERLRELHHKYDSILRDLNRPLPKGYGKRWEPSTQEAILHELDGVLKAYDAIAVNLGHWDGVPAEFEKPITDAEFDLVADMAENYLSEGGADTVERVAWIKFKRFIRGRVAVALVLLVAGLQAQTRADWSRLGPRASGDGFFRQCHSFDGYAWVSRLEEGTTRVPIKQIRMYGIEFPENRSVLMIKGRWLFAPATDDGELEVRFSMDTPNVNVLVGQVRPYEHRTAGGPWATTHQARMGREPLARIVWREGRYSVIRVAQHSNSCEAWQ